MSNIKFRIVGTPMLLNAPQNIEHIKTYLNHFILFGDSIARHENSDTLSVFRKGKRYDFMMPTRY